MQGQDFAGIVLDVLFWGALTSLGVTILATAVSVSGAHVVALFINKRAARKLFDRGLDVGLVAMVITLLLSIACIVMSWSMGVRRELF